jgi:ABC-type sugar transport system substrate-binding protein
MKATTIFNEIQTVNRPAALVAARALSYHKREHIFVAGLDATEDMQRRLL